MTGANVARLPTARAADTDTNQLSLAEQMLDILTEETGERPVYSLGSFHLYSAESGLWSPMSTDAMAILIGRQFYGSKLCRKASDYRQIASLTAPLSENETFFSDAPGGVAAGGAFYMVTDAGEIVSEPVTAAHRQRMGISAKPNFDAEAALLNRLLDNAFGKNTAGIAQKNLLQMALGAALTCTLWRYRTVLMLYGASSTGKSTLLEVLKRFFPADRVGATNPANWTNEYHAAALAGRSLNLVGELDGTTPIQGGTFKAVTGGDVIEARHPTHRPFSFVCVAGHIFNCNRLPPTRDKSDAFFRRWRIVEFANSVTPGAEIIGLADQIFNKEQSAVLAWLLEGAARLAKQGGFPHTDNHNRLIQYWRAGNNSALQFLLDTEFVEVGSAKTPSTPIAAKEVFAIYRKWAHEAGVKAMGRNAFYEAVAEGAGRLGVVIADDKDRVKQISGIGLKVSGI